MHIFEEQIIWQFQKEFFESLWIRAKPPDTYKVDILSKNCCFDALRVILESRPPLKLKNKWGLLSEIFL